MSFARFSKSWALRAGGALSIVAVIVVCGLTACSIPTGGRVIGGAPVAITDLPAYPGSVELEPGESKIADPLLREAQQEPLPFIGLGIEVEKAQRTFRVPKETTFVQLKSFYADKLQATGWREDGAIRFVLDQANLKNEQLQSALFIRVDQTLLIVLITDPANGEKELQLSLAMH